MPTSNTSDTHHSLGQKCLGLLLLETNTTQYTGERLRAHYVVQAIRHSDGREWMRHVFARQNYQYPRLYRITAAHSPQNYPSRSHVRRISPRQLVGMSMSSLLLVHAQYNYITKYTRTTTGASLFGACFPAPCRCWHQRASPLAFLRPWRQGSLPRNLAWCSARNRHCLCPSHSLTRGASGDRPPVQVHPTSSVLRGMQRGLCRQSLHARRIWQIALQIGTLRAAKAILWSAIPDDRGPVMSCDPMAIGPDASAHFMPYLGMSIPGLPFYCVPRNSKDRRIFSLSIFPAFRLMNVPLSLQVARAHPACVLW